MAGGRVRGEMCRSSGLKSGPHDGYFHNLSDSDDSPEADIRAEG